MGIYDRDYYQDERPAGINIGSQWSMTTKLIVLNVGIYIINIFMGGRLMEAISASPRSLAEPWYAWQLLSYSFGHDPQHVSHIFWNMFGLFVFGRDVETLLGAKEYLRFYLLTAFLGGLAWALRGLMMAPSDMWGVYQVLGASGAVTGVTILFCLHYPKRTLLLMMVFPVPAWIVGALIIAVNLFGATNQGETQVAYDVHLVGAAFAFAYYRFTWRLARFTPSFSLGKGLLKRKPKLRIHEPTSNESYEAKDGEADRLLEKVKRDGMNSLSDKERRVLEDYSRRMRQKHR